MGQVKRRRNFSRLAAFLLGFGWTLPVSFAFDFDRIQQVLQQRHGNPGVLALKDWKSAIDAFRSGSETQKLRDINEYFNRKLRFDTDQNIWGTSDYWATPIEALMKGVADCEDFAIAKFFTLIDMGVAANKLRITYVKARFGGPGSTITQAHMVLTYYSTPDAEPLILDNLVSEIRPASRRADLVPIFSFNTDGLWTVGAGGDEAQGGGTSRLSRWNDLLAKMKSEGF